MPQYYPQVRQFETIRFEAIQRARLLDELREPAARHRRGWRFRLLPAMTSIPCAGRTR
jgi:hypothetical protein